MVIKEVQVGHDMVMKVIGSRVYAGPAVLRQILLAMEEVLVVHYSIGNVCMKNILKSSY